jgi:hypothetical protein
MNTGFTIEPGVEVLIFRTNIRFKKDLRLVSAALGKITGVLRWNVDREDTDKVLRIESSSLQPADVIQLITAAGFQCEELPE